MATKTILKHSTLHAAIMYKFTSQEKLVEYLKKHGGIEFGEPQHRYIYTPDAEGGFIRYWLNGANMPLPEGAEWLKTTL